MQRDWALAIPASWGFSPREAATMKTRQEGFKEPLLMALRSGGDFGDIPTSCQNHLFQGSSLFLPCSALAANMRFLGGTERHPRTSWGAPRPSKSTGVHPANFSFELEVLFGHFCQLVLMYVWCWGLFVLQSVYLGLHIRHPLRGFMTVLSLVCECVFCLCDWYSCLL